MRQGFSSPQRHWPSVLSCHNQSSFCSNQLKPEKNTGAITHSKGLWHERQNIPQQWKGFLYIFDIQNVYISTFLPPDIFLDAFMCLLGSRAPEASGNFFHMCRAAKPWFRAAKPHIRLWRAEDSNSWKQQALLASGSEHNSAAWGFGVSVRREKSFGHVLRVSNVVWHQSLLFGVWEWEVEVIDIRQASALSLRGIGMWWVEPDLQQLLCALMGRWFKACLTVTTCNNDVVVKTKQHLTTNFHLHRSTWQKAESWQIALKKSSKQNVARCETCLQVCKDSQRKECLFF